MIMQVTPFDKVVKNGALGCDKACEVIRQNACAAVCTLYRMLTIKNHE